MDETKPVSGFIALEKPVLNGDVVENATLSIDLPLSAHHVLQGLADAKGVTVAEALRHAVVISEFLDRMVQDGAKILIDHGGLTTELVQF